MSNYFYLTTTLPYVNAKPHIGFAFEMVEADVIARYQRLLGKKVFFNTGSDEHGQKIYQKALENNLSPQEYCDRSVLQFANLKTLLNLSYNSFMRTTDQKHVTATQEFWKRSLANDDIYLADYEVKYCVGCELEKTESELTNNRCPLHPNQELEIRKEKNYFFRFSKYQQSLLDYFQTNPEFVYPESKMSEIISFVEQGLNDFSISRIKDKMPWGVEVPGDPNQVMYVWFDALINYISALGWPENQAKFDRFWPGIQLAGKDNLRQQAAMWQAMLMSVNLPNSSKILINGFISVEGQKMSKSLGNVISPAEMVSKYQADATRYLLISLGTFDRDMDVSWNKFDLRYQADLSNGIGNLCSRIAKMCDTVQLKYELENEQGSPDTTKDRFNPEFTDLMDHYQLTAGLEWINDFVKAIDLYLSEKKPWQMPAGLKKKETLTKAVTDLHQVAVHLEPFMPETSLTIRNHFQGKINALLPIFPRLR